MSPPSSENAIYISGVTLRVEQASNKTVDQIVFRTQTGGIRKEILGRLSPGQERKEVFDVPLELSIRDELCVSMQYQSQLLCIERTPHFTLVMKHSDIMKELQEGKRTYVKLHRKITVILDISSELAATEAPHAHETGPPSTEPSHGTLPPTTNDHGPSSSKSIHGTPPLPINDRGPSSTESIYGIPSPTTNDRGPSFTESIHGTLSPTANDRGPPSTEKFRGALSPIADYRGPSSIESSNGALPPATNDHGPSSIESSNGALPPATNDHGPSSIENFHGTLSPTTSEILRICPRFRLLIIGNSGVGKSSLIREVFGVTDVLVSEATRGEAEINREFVSEKNGLFVLHDSVGLEAAESNNLATVKKFVRERRRMKDLKDRLHAVWVCLQVPYAKGRLLEAGMEEFLKDRRDIFGDIPIVVVLTKLDLLDNNLIMALRAEGAKFRTIKEAQTLLQPQRAKYLEEHCTKLLQQAASDIPHVAVSTKSGYDLEQTIPELVKRTTLEIEQYILVGLPHGPVSEQQAIERNAPLYVAEMAQRARIEGKVDLTIEIGKKKYWANLRAGLRLSAEKVEEYLFVIHCDIIQVWNFNDPENALQSNGFKEALLDTQGLEIQDNSGGGKDAARLNVSTSFPLISDPISAVVTLPIIGIIALRKLYSEISESAQTIAKRFMAYITDLIYVIRILFILAPHGSITAQDVDRAVEIYTKTAYRNRIHLEVNDFYATGPMVGRNAVADRIEVLVRKYDVIDEVLGRWNQMGGNAASRGS